MFLALNDIYEPSAIQQLPDGRFLVVEDEKTHPLSLLAIRPDGATERTPLGKRGSIHGSRRCHIER
jgi:hypothetical protein